jgi:hypothetical protein
MCFRVVAGSLDLHAIYDTKPNRASEPIWLKKRTQRRGHVLSGGRRVSRLARNLRYEAKSGQRADLKKRTQRRGHVLSGCRRVSRLARNLRYEAKSGQRADLKKRTQRRGHVLSGCRQGSRLACNLRYEAKSGQRADLKERTQRRVHMLSGCRRVRDWHAIYNTNRNRASEPISKNPTAGWPLRHWEQIRLVRNCVLDNNLYSVFKDRSRGIPGLAEEA